MSWFSENYEKAAIGGAAAIVVGLGFIIWSSHNAASGAFEVEASEKIDDASVAGLPRMQEVNESLTKDHEIVTASVNDRSVNLFTSIPLFVKRNDESTAIDLEEGGAVHEGIDNKFWLQYGLDPGFENSPQLDPDEDGFTNMDEYTAGTSPVEFDSHPDPVLKLAIVSVETTQLHIKASNFGSDKATFRIETKGRKSLGKINTPIKPGELIAFTNDFMKNRFKFVSYSKDSGVGLWEIEDLKPNKKGRRYLFNRRGNMAGAAKREFGIMDSIVEFELKAIKQEGKTFKVEENNKFSLPYGAEEKNYLFKSIDLDKKMITIEYKDKDGEIKMHSINF